MLLTEYDAKKQRKMDIRDAREEGHQEGREEGRAEGREEGRKEGREEGRAEGHEEGVEEGREQIFDLMKRMEEDGESDQILRLTRDPAFLREMLARYGERKL